MMKFLLPKGLALLLLSGWLTASIPGKAASKASGTSSANIPEAKVCHINGQPSFRFMTYNIRNGKGMDKKTDYGRIAQEILQCGADFVAIQEADSATSRNGKRYVLGELALQTQMYPIFAKAIPMKGGAYGIGLLCRERPLHTRQYRLPGREEARTLLIAEFQSFYLACTHWSLNAKDRMTSAREICRIASTLKDKPLLLAGDFNATPDSPEMKVLTEDFFLVNNPQSPTYPSDIPEKTIDYIAVWKPRARQIYWSEQHTHVIAAKEASDHRPVVADFRIKTPANRFFYGRPYLQNPTNGGITVMFQTRQPAYCWVEFTSDTLLAARGETPLYKVRTLVGGQAVCHDIEQKIRLEHLDEGNTYYYRVCGQEFLENRAYYKALGDTVRTPFFSFTLPEKENSNFTAIILNDMHGVDQVEQKMAQLARSIPHDLVFLNGDCLPEPADRMEAITNVNRLSERFEGSTHPIFFIRGNHEIRNAYSSGMTSLFDYPSPPEPKEPKNQKVLTETAENHWLSSTPENAPKTYGSFSWGDTRFVYLDCGEDKPDDTWVYYGLNDFSGFRQEQATFLKQELGSRNFRRADRHILLSHIPLWGNTDEYQPCTDLWGPILKKASWDVGLFAHTHEFRFYETDSIAPFPIYIGGGYDLQTATMAVIRKEDKKMSLEVYNAEGQILLRKEL